jgi:hypothetical protein
MKEKTHVIRRLGFVLAIMALVSGAGLLLRAEPPQEVGSWASIGAAPENRIGAAAVALADGRTLIAGGLADGTPTAAVVVFDPADSSFATAGQLLEPRAGHTATLLDDGRVLIAGGKVNDILSGDVEIFDPSDGSSTLVATLAILRSGHAAARFGSDGKVLIAGGTGAEGVLQSAEIFDPANGSVSLAGSGLSIGRTGASATALIDGRVLIAGGSDGNQDLLSAEIYNPSTDSFQPTDTNLDAPRSNHTAVLLPHNNSVLIAGGTSNGAPLATADLFLPAQFPDPFTYGMGQFALTGEMAAPRSGAAAGPHIEGYAFVVGGGQPDAEVYRFATIKTDKDDYPPGQTAIITGSGWQPNEEVTLLFQEDPAVHADYVLTVTADGEGNIYHDQWAPEEHDLNVRFYLLAKQPTAHGQRRAQMTFTDHSPAPTDLTATAVPPSQINLSWIGPTNATGANADHDYHLERCAGSGCLGFAEIATIALDGGTNDYADTGLSPGTYRYRVRYHHHLAAPAVFSGYSNIAEATLVAANTAPVAVDDSATVNEDSVSNVIDVLANDTDADNVSPALPNAGLTVVAVGAASNGTVSLIAGVVTYTPTADYCGPDSFTYTVSDDGTSNAGHTEQGAVSIDVTCINDVPSFTAGGNVTVLEDSGAYSAAWATGISAGPSNESGQALNFIVSNSNPSLFSVQPAISPSGVLSFTPAPDAAGNATVDVQIHDDGGGADTSAVQSFTITVTAVNDEPSFTSGGDVTVLEDSASYSATWATAIDDGDPEVSQALAFHVSNNNNGLFSSQPAIDSSGNLTFALTANANGSALVSVYLTDNGGTANTGDDDTSPTQTFTIYVTAVNDAPSFTAGANQTVLVNAGAQSVANWATNLSAGPPDESGQALNFLVSNNNNALFSAQPTIDSNGTLTFTPALNAAGSALVSVQIHDNGGTANGGVDTSAAQTFVISMQYSTGSCLGSPGLQILQPINVDGSSTFKQKSTVPAKFRVCDANGASIGTPGVVTDFRLIQIINGGITSVNEEVDSTTPDTAFRWSGTDQQWIFNVNTKNLFAGKHYRYRITLNSGQMIEFEFGLK